MIDFPTKKHFINEDLKSLNAFILSQNKDYGVVKANLMRIAKIYARYRFAVAFPYKHRMKPRLSDSCAKVMHDMYERRILSLSYIAETREKAKRELGCCPYCGLPGTMTLDHYLPKALKAFPEYAVLSENLVPACGDCQSTKLEKYSLRSHTRFIIRRRSRPAKSRKHKSLAVVSQPFVSRPMLRIWHPYLDNFLDSTVLAIAREPGGNYRVFARRHLDKWLRKCVEHHVHELGMSARASHFIRRTKDAYARLFRSESVCTEQGIRVRLPGLLKEALGEAYDNENAIKVAYVRTLMTDREMLKELTDETLRPPQRNKNISRSYRKAP